MVERGRPVRKRNRLKEEGQAPNNEILPCFHQPTRPPSPIARRFMDEIERDPEYWLRRTAHSAAGIDTDGANG